MSPRLLLWQTKHKLPIEDGEPVGVSLPRHDERSCVDVCARDLLHKIRETSIEHESSREAGVLTWRLAGQKPF